jgi:hypothetical protein
MTPLLCQWTGESFEPARRHAKDCNAALVVGQSYMIDVAEPRSEAAHRSFFASINEAWKSLREDDAERFPTADHMRRYALIKAGFCKRTDVVCANNNEAMRLAAMVKGLDTYSLTIVSERVVSTWTAESQSHKSMGKKRFDESQQAVRDYCASILGVESKELPESEAA